MDTFCVGRLSLPPGVNASYQNIHIKGKYNRIGSTQELKDFKEMAGWELKQAQVNWEAVGDIHACQCKEVHIPLELHLIFYYPTLWKHDVDSGVKAVQDAIFRHLGLNDNLVCKLTVVKSADREDPRVDFHVSLAIKDMLWQ